MLDRMQDDTCRFLFKVIVQMLGSMVQVVIFAGLLIAGTMYAFGLGGGPQWWVVPAGYLAWFFGLLSMIFYILAVPLAVYRDTARKFWGGWCPLNFGLTLFGITLIFTRIELPLVLAWPCLLGVGIGFAVFRWNAIASRCVLILFNVLLLAPILPFVTLYWEVLVLPLATTLVIVPVLCAANVELVSPRRTDRDPPSA